MLQAPRRGWWCALRRRHRTDHNKQHAQTEHTGAGRIGQAGSIPRQRGADTGPTAPPQDPTEARRRARDGARRVVVRVWAWLCAVGAGAAGWCRARVVVCPLGRMARRGALWCWRPVEPALRDGAGWLIHTAPGVTGRLLARVLAWVPVALAGLARHAAVGAGWLAARIARYCLAWPEYAGVVREAREADKPRRARVAIVAWRRAATRRSAGLALLALATGVGLRWLDRTHGAIAVAGLAVAVVLIIAGVGRAVRPTPGPEPGAEAEPGPDEPFPIADAHTRTEAAEAVTRAVRAEGIDVRTTGEAARQPWGWQVPVILRRGTPAGLVAKLAELETTLDLPAGGLLASPDRDRRARVMLRLAERDPFAGLPPAPDRPPASASIRDAHTVARRMDGTDLALCLLGVHTVVIGVPGAGKTHALRTLADAISACADAIVWDLDPSGTGLDVLGAGIGRRERDPTGIDDALADALALAEVRPRMLSGLDMGDAWQPCPARPALLVVIDEYPRLTNRAKALAVDLLRVGRKARVTVLLASSEATSDALGAAIADTTAAKILLPCRHTDVRLTLGPNMIAEGWRPDRLHPATGESAEDAGKGYVYAAGTREPVITQFRTLDPDKARDNGAHRGAVGLPRIDTHSWTAARARRARDTGAPEDERGARAGDRQVAADVLAAFGTDPKLWTDDLLTRLATAHDRYGGWTADDLAAALRPFGVTPTQVWLHGRNRNGYDRDTLAHALDTRR